jgi:carbonic anhydrase
MTIPAAEALARLKDGNARFVADAPNLTVADAHLRRGDLIEGQAPFAIILGCSDSRVPLEVIFDQGLGDLFVIRVAGNVAGPSQVGSVEFAAAEFGTRLVVVMGHTGCGAVQATLEQIGGAAPASSANLQSIVDRIRPAVEGLASAAPGWTPESLIGDAVRTNVDTSVNDLTADSDLLQRLVDGEGLQVVGAEYCLETGVVEFFGR